MPPKRVALWELRADGRQPLDILPQPQPTDTHPILNRPESVSSQSAISSHQHLFNFNYYSRHLSREKTMSLTANKKRPAPTIASSYEYPIRNIDALYCSHVTYACARGALSASPMEAQNASDPSSIETPEKPCISCAYKIANFDIALDSEFTRAVPNVRPECCPRFKRQYHGNKCNDINHQDMPDSSVMGYQKGMSVLTVGDGDFTFSLAVARLVCGASSGKVVATSYEDQSTLRNVYPDFTSTLKELEQYNNTK
eukprot:scaffold294427_cov76-Cyclotella_meneghiniana.AAC.1